MFELITASVVTDDCMDEQEIWRDEPTPQTRAPKSFGPKTTIMTKRPSPTSIALATFVALIDMHHSSVLGFSARPHHNTSFQKKYYAPNFSSSASWTSSCSQHCRILALEENSDDGGSRNNITPLCDLQTFLRLGHIVHICLSHSCFVTTYQIKMDTFLCAWN